MTTETTERDLVTEVEELLAKATPGPWVWEFVGEFDSEASNAGGFTYQHIRAGYLGVADTYHASGAQWPDGSVSPPRDGNAHDANLIAAAPELLRRLVEEVEKLRAENAELRKCDACERKAVERACRHHGGRP